jgi:threonine 3-dehydrogenase
MHTSLITGGFGCLGCYLLRALVEQGERVVVFDVASGSPLVSDIQDDMIAVRGDLTIKSDLVDAVVQHGVDCIFHLGALQALTGAEKDLYKTFCVNVVGTMNVLEVARAHRVAQVLYASSQGAYGPLVSGLVDDDAPQFPRTMYGVTKVCSERLGEQYHRRYGLDFRGLRLPPMPAAGRDSYGSSAFVDAAIRNALLGRPYVFDVAPDSRIPTALYIKDAVRAFLMLRRAESSHLSHRVYNINGFGVTALEIAVAVRNRVPEAVLSFQPNEAWVSNILSWPTMDDSRAREDWGWAPAFQLEEYLDDLSREVRSKPSLYA